jgi:hypothetical protein
MRVPRPRCPIRERSPVPTRPVWTSASSEHRDVGTHARQTSICTLWDVVGSSVAWASHPSEILYNCRHESEMQQPTQCLIVRQRSIMACRGFERSGTSGYASVCRPEFDSFSRARLLDSGDLGASSICLWREVVKFQTDHKLELHRILRIQREM